MKKHHWNDWGVSVKNNLIFLWSMSWQSVCLASHWWKCLLERRKRRWKKRSDQSKGERKIGSWNKGTGLSFGEALLKSLLSNDLAEFRKVLAAQIAASNKVHLSRKTGVTSFYSQTGVNNYRCLQLLIGVWWVKDASPTKSTSNA